MLGKDPQISGSSYKRGLSSEHQKLTIRTNISPRTKFKVVSTFKSAYHLVYSAARSPPNFLNNAPSDLGNEAFSQDPALPILEPQGDSGVSADGPIPLDAAAMRLAPIPSQRLYIAAGRSLNH